MTNNEIAKKILQITRTGYYEDQLDKIVKLLEASKPVSGELPSDSAIKEIENLMERWHLARDNDGETLQGINDALVKIGLLGWFNKQ